jgi:L-alanine-DL-glutamate epimerase-like enolase superfamily enzyme
MLSSALRSRSPEVSSPGSPRNEDHSPRYVLPFADPTRDPLWFELFRERPKIVDGFMAVPEAPGLGLELREDTLEKYGVKLG